MITDAERKAAMLALETFRKNLNAIMDTKEGTYFEYTDVTEAITNSIYELSETDVVKGSY